jgi:hypothetical protein
MTAIAEMNASARGAVAVAEFVVAYRNLSEGHCFMLPDDPSGETRQEYVARLIDAFKRHCDPDLLAELARFGRVLADNLSGREDDPIITEKITLETGIADARGPEAASNPDAGI